MEKPLQIIYRNVEPSPKIDQLIRNKVEKLEKFYSRIIGCRVVVDLPHQHGAQIFHVSVFLEVPHTELVVNRDHGDNQAHVDLQIAVRDSFEAAKRQLEDYVEKLRRT